MGTGCSQKTWSFLTGFLSSPAETLQNWGTWSEQAGIMLSGQRRLGLEGKDQYETSGMYNPLLSTEHTAKHTAHAQAIHIFLMGNVRYISSQASAAVAKPQEAVCPSVRGGRGASVGWLSIAPRRSSCKCSCAPLPSNLNTVLLHSLILLLCPHGSGPTQFNRIAHVAGSLALCPRAVEPWKHRHRPHLGCALGSCSPTALLLVVADLIRLKAVYAQAPEMQSGIPTARQAHPAKALVGYCCQHRRPVPDLPPLRVPCSLCQQCTGSLWCCFGYDAFSWS